MVGRPTDYSKPHVAGPDNMCLSCGQEFNPCATVLLGMSDEEKRAREVAEYIRNANVEKASRSDRTWWRRRVRALLRKIIRVLQGWRKRL